VQVVYATDEPDDGEHSTTASIMSGNTYTGLSLGYALETDNRRQRMIGSFYE
jgi:hypothetical protein